MTKGIIDFLKPEGKFGFIRSESGQRVHFYFRVLGKSFRSEDLRLGIEVEFDFVQAERGPTATRVEIAGIESNDWRSARDRAWAFGQMQHESCRNNLYNFTNMTASCPRAWRAWRLRELRFAWAWQCGASWRAKGCHSRLPASESKTGLRKGTRRARGTRALPPSTDRRARDFQRGGDS